MDEVLKRLEKDGCLFHGSDNGEIGVLEPRPGYDDERGREEPAVSATSFVIIAVFRAISRREWYTTFGYSPQKRQIKIEMASRVKRNLLRKNKRGFVYVLSRKGFKRFGKEGGEYRCKKSVKPVAVIPVTASDFFEMAKKRKELKVDVIRFAGIKMFLKRRATRSKK